MKKTSLLIFAIILSLNFLSLTATGIKADEATSASDTTLTNKIKSRLQETAEEGLDSIKDELEQKATQPKKKAYIGTIASITADQIELKYKQAAYSIHCSDTTVFEQSPGKTQLDIDDLEIDDFVIAMGFVTQDEPLDAHRVLIISSPQTPPVRQLISGRIEEIDDSRITVDSKTITISSKTNLQIKEVEDATIEDLELDDYLFAIVILDEDGDINSTTSVLVMPGKNNPAAMTPTNAEATESAAATDSADTDTEE